MNKCAKILKKIRDTLYITQLELAEALDISAASICKYEQSKTIPNLPIARKIKAFADKNNVRISMSALIRS